jgi:prophage DNA circulation protein
MINDPETTRTSSWRVEVRWRSGEQSTVAGFASPAAAHAFVAALASQLAQIEHVDVVAQVVDGPRRKRPTPELTFEGEIRR